MTGSEGDALLVSASRSRAADHDVAAALGRAAPAGAGATAGYLGELARRAALSETTERDLIIAAQAGDAQARVLLVEAFVPRVAAVARVYRETARVDRVELLQEGVVGLLRALENYDPGRGVPFWGYASFWVRQAMQQLVAELTRPMVLSDRALRQLARVKDAHRSAVRETGQEPGREELAVRSGLTSEQVDDLLAADRSGRSLDEPIPGADGAVGRFGDLLVDPLSEDQYERVLDAIEVQQLVALLAALSDREREILRLRYGLEGAELSLRQVGARLGLSAERVRQLEERALGKLAAAAGGRERP